MILSTLTCKIAIHS